MIKDEVDFVSEWREDSGTTLSPVQFKLFSLSNHPGYAVLSIRGSETMWDWIQNIQLWSAAGLSQIVKWVIPYGWIFNPILPDFIQAVNFIEVSHRSPKSVATCDFNLSRLIHPCMLSRKKLARLVTIR